MKNALPGPEPRAVEHVGVLGAGLMGSGIATVSLPQARVTVKDVSPEALELCAKAVRAAVDRRVLRSKLGPAERDAMLRGLKLTDRTEDLAGCDLLIEAVFEDLDLKHRVLAEVEQHVRADAIIASNTSALYIGAIAKHASHPERVIGMHYFSPVPKMPLLELVVAARTAPWVVATARAFAMKQGKTVIVVRDRPGFFTSRILAPFLNEAAVLLREGAAIEVIDAGAVGFGFPVGPLTLLDALGIDVAAHVLRDLSAIFPHPEPSGGRALTTLFEAGYAGRKNGRGFYRYNDETARGKQRPANPEVYEILGSAKIRELPSGEIASRLALSMANEATRCLHEEIIACPRDGDVGAVLGLGFPPFRGGPFRYLDGLGLRTAVDTLQRLRDEQGLRFEPSPLLKDMARENRRFYEQY